MTYLTERPLYRRIYEHNRLTQSKIFEHINKCEIFEKQLHSKYGINYSQTERRSFIEPFFSIISTNNTNYYKRTRIEGLAISLNKPELNNQNEHTKITII